MKTSQQPDGIPPAPYCREITIPPHNLEGRLTVPEECTGLILFAHGSGSSRLSPRNNMVAEMLNRRGLGTLLFDLLRPEESHDIDKVFDISLLAERLEEATEWVDHEPDLKGLKVGFFGASTGAAAAITAAARSKSPIAAVVSRGGRPDLADDQSLRSLRAPTCLIVGASDHEVLALNEQALLKLACETKLGIIPHATHLFEEPGTLERVAEIAADWFDHFMTTGRTASDVR